MPQAPLIDSRRAKVAFAILLEGVEGMEEAVDEAIDANTLEDTKKFREAVKRFKAEKGDVKQALKLGSYGKWREMFQLLGVDW
jgi:hypothetical protein